MFKRTASFKITAVLKNEQSFQDWRDLVKKANGVGKTTKAFLEPGIFEYKPEKFLYFTSRAISSVEKHGPNRNGDAFPWQELTASHETFVGKGFYIEHDEDSIEKAKGLVLDAVLHTDEEYIETLNAVDRNLFPEVAGQIESGIINCVSMSCNCQTAECSECGTVATNAAELCDHCRQYDDSEGTIANVNYCKGKLGPSGKTAHEINRGIIFTGLSGVAIPADGNAHIFEVFASMKGELEKHLFEYQLARSQDKKKNILKQAMAKLSKAEIKILADTAKEVEGEGEEEVNVKEKAKEIKQEAEEGPKLQSLIDDAGQKVADNAMKGAIKEVIEEKIERMIEPQKLMIKKVVAPKIEDKLNQVVPQIEQAVKDLAGGTLVAASIVKKAEENDSKKEGEPIKELNEIKEVALGDGWILKQSNKDNKIMMEVFDRDESTGQFIEMLPEDVSETEKVTKYREILDLDSEAKENIKEEVKKMNNLTFKYITVAGSDAADSLERSFFTVKAADKKMKIVRAKYLLSQEEGDAIVSGKSAIEPEEFCKKLAEVHTDYDTFIKHASTQKEEFKKVAAVEVKVEEKPTMSLRKKAFLARKAKGEGRFSQFSFNEKEITKEKQKEAGDKPVVSVNEKEAAAGAKDSAPATAKGHGSKIKQLYSRLPSNTSVGGEPTEAIDRKSKSLGEHARILRQAVEKQRMLEASLKDKDAKIALLAKEVEEGKKEKEVDAKAEIISEITSGLKDSECKTKVKEQLMELDEASLVALKSVLDLMNEKEEEGKPKEEELNAEAGLDFDQIPALSLSEDKIEGNELNSVEALAQAWGQNTLDRMQGN